MYMKIFTTAAIFLIPFLCFGQLDTMTLQDKGFVFRDVIDFKGHNKDIIYSNLLVRTKQLFRDAQLSIPVEDKELGFFYFELRSNDLKYNSSGINNDGGFFTYEVTIEAKDERARITFSNLRHEGCSMFNTKDGSRYEDVFPSTWSKGRLGRKEATRNWHQMKSDFKSELLGFHSKISEPIVLDDDF